MSGKLISINGPSFSGKTYFSSKLTNYILASTSSSLSNISFESIFDVSDTFAGMSVKYKELARVKLSKFDIVIAESTIINFDNAFNILCLPPIENHVSNYNIYKKNFGVYDAIRRSYWNDITKMRKEFDKVYKYKPDYTNTMSANSIEKCFKEVMCYVSNK